MSGKGRHSGRELRGGSGNGGREEKRTLLLVGLSMRTIEADVHQDQIDGAGMNQAFGALATRLLPAFYRSGARWRPRAETR